MDTQKTLIYEHRGWRYEVTLDLQKNLFEIKTIDEYHTPVPNLLYKYYSLNNYSIDALTKSYIFAAHPRHFNDPYDCNMNIFDLSNTPLIAYKTYLKPLEDSDPNLSISNLFESNKKQLDYLYLNAYWQIMYSKCGIISLTDNPINIQMWSYYSLLNGFQIGLNPALLPSNFKGPLKVRYVEDFDKIPIKNDLYIPMIYQVSNKEINWRHESEWRYLVIGHNEMEVPYAVFKKLQKNPHDRKFSYDKKAIEEITLGCYFFTVDEKVEEGYQTYIFDLSELAEDKRSKKQAILDYIIENPDIRFFFLAWQKLKDFKLIKIPSVIEKLDTYVYKMRMSPDIYAA